MAQCFCIWQFLPWRGRRSSSCGFYGAQRCTRSSPVLHPRGILRRNMRKMNSWLRSGWELRSTQMRSGQKYGSGCGGLHSWTWSQVGLRLPNVRSAGQCRGRPQRLRQLRGPQPGFIFGWFTSLGVCKCDHVGSELGEWRLTTHCSGIQAQAFLMGYLSKFFG